LTAAWTCAATESRGGSAKIPTPSGLCAVIAVRMDGTQRGFYCMAAHTHWCCWAALSVLRSQAVRVLPSADDSVAALQQPAVLRCCAVASYWCICHSSVGAFLFVWVSSSVVPWSVMVRSTCCPRALDRRGCSAANSSSSAERPSAEASQLLTLCSLCACFDDARW